MGEKLGIRIDIPSIHVVIQQSVALRVYSCREGAGVIQVYRGDIVIAVKIILVIPFPNKQRLTRAVENIRDTNRRAGDERSRVTTLELRKVI